MARSGEKTENKKPAKQPAKKVNPLWKEFLGTLSSSEVEAYNKDMVSAMPSFRKFIEAKSDADLVVLVTK